MRIRFAAGFTFIALLCCGLAAILALRPGLYRTGEFTARQAWLLDNSWLWTAGMWLFLVGIFSWMVFLVSLLWSYSPAHRMTTMLQSGLMIISATLAIGGVVTWMSVLPEAVEQPEAHLRVPLVDALALGLLSAGLFMGGVVTAWIGLDLARLDAMPAGWLVPMILAGVSAAPAPFLLPHQPWLLAAGALLWLGGALHLALRRNLPNAYTEWG
jgi:hypothetical protein